MNKAVLTSHEPIPGNVLEAAGRLRPMKVLLVQTQAESGGAQEITRILCGGLRARGIDARQLFMFRRTAVFDDDPHASYCAQTRPGNPFALARMLFTLLREIRRQRPDAVMCFQHYGNIIAGPVARLAGCPVVIANRVSAAETMPGWVRSVEGLMTRLGVFSRMVVNSANVAAEYSAASAAVRRRLHRIDHGFAPKVSDMPRNEARRKFDLPQGATVIGSVARLHPLKNLGAAIDLLPRNDNWHLAIAGDGPARAELEQRAERLGCAGRLHLLGEKTSGEIGELFAALDLFVFPTLAETFGLAAVEAAQAGLPVVANDLEVLREVLQTGDEDCAVFTDCSETAAFGKTVEAVLANPEHCRELSQRGRLLEERYSSDAMVDAYRRLTERLAAGREATA